MDSKIVKGKNGGKTREFPNALVILLAITLVCAILTYIVPAGQYARVLDEATGRMVVDPLSFEYIENTPVGPFEFLLSIQEGLIQAADITFLIFMAFSSLYVIEKTGAIDACIVLMTKKIKDKPKYANLMIALVMSIITIWASTGTLSYEEIIAFIPIFITLSIALGYDALVGIGMSYIAVGVGFASATVNPFTIGVAQGISELPLYSGLAFRMIVLIVMLAISITYVLSYANKIKKDPGKSILKNVDYSDFTIEGERAKTKLTNVHIVTLITLFIGVAIMAYGLIEKGWYINEIGAVFFGITIVVGIVNRWNPNKLATTFIEGLSKGVLSALVVGFARGILVVLTKGQIIDTIIHSCANMLSELSLYVSGVGMLVFQSILNFFIPSGSGQAAVSMPIMAPIADLIGMNRQIGVLIYQFGDGFSNMLWPTGFLIIACAIGKIPINKYYKWFLPLFGMIFAAQVMFIFIAISINYGPF